MNYQRVLLTLFMLLIGCNITAAPTASPDKSDAENAPKQDLVQQTKELGQAVWEETKQRTKKARNTIQKKSKKYYEVAKDHAGDTAEVVAKKSKSYYKTAKDTSQEYLEKATDTTKDVTSTVKDKANNYYESSKEAIQKTLESDEKITNSTI